MSNYLLQRKVSNSQLETVILSIDNLPLISTVTENSTAPITSGAVFSALALKQNTLTAGNGITITGSTIAATVPTATTTTLGGIIVGDNLTITTAGVLSASAPAYTSGEGINISGTTISNGGVRSVTTGTTNGTISINTNGTSADVAVKGLGSNAYTSTTYAPAATTLTKLTYQYQSELSCGSNGKVCLGKFTVYDSNITISISSTTNTTYNGILVIATQNYWIQTISMYGNENSALNNLIKIVPSNITTGDANYHILEVYASLSGWSKNIIKIDCANLLAAPTDILTSITSIPTTATFEPVYLFSSMLSTKQATLTFDTTPTALSTNPVTSAGIKTVVDAKADDSSVVHKAGIETINGTKTFSSADGIIINTSVLKETSKTIQSTATDVLDVSKKTFFENGAVFNGTAASAGLVTKGISGCDVDGNVLTPLYLNYRGSDVYDGHTFVYLGGTSSGYIAARRDDFLFGAPTANYVPVTFINGNNVSTTKNLSIDGHTHSFTDLLDKPTIDSALSTTSINAVQNKIINAAINTKQNTLTAGNGITITDSTIAATVPIYIQTATPTVASGAFALWIDTGNGNIIKFYNGTAWANTAATYS